MLQPTHSIVAMAASLGLFSGLLAPEGAQAQASPTEIVIAVSSNSFPVAGVRLVDKMGFLEKNGLKARFIVSESGSQATAALLAGSVNFIAAGLEELIALRGRGNEDTVLVSNIYHGQPGVVVLRKEVAAKLGVKPDDPPAARLKALEGLTLAAPSPTSGILSGVRISARITGVNIRYTYVAQTAMVAALQAGAINSFVASSPFWEPAVNSGAAVRWLSGPSNEYLEEATTISPSCLQASRVYAERNPDVIRRVRAGFRELATAIRERPADVLRALKQIVSRPAGKRRLRSIRAERQELAAAGFHRGRSSQGTKDAEGWRDARISTVIQPLSLMAPQ